MTDVLVVGGGPAGSATAYFLARAGVDVTVLERARYPRPKPCSEYLSPEAARLLDAMGALPAIEQGAVPAARLRGMVVRAPNGTSFRGDFVASHGYAGYRDYGLAVRRVVLDGLLAERARAAGARVEEGVRVGELLVERGTVRGVRTLDAAGRATDRAARFVVGADGLRSLVARRLGLAHARAWPRRLAFVAHYRGVAGVGPYGEMHVERDGYVGLADVGGGLTNVAVVVPLSQGRAAGGSRGAFLEEWVARRPHLAPRFARAERVSPVWATGPFASHAPRAWAPGAALVGDAADFFDPFTGEGIYAALRGAELLAPSLLEALAAATPCAAADALAGYDAARRRSFGPKWTVERLVGVAVGVPGVMNRAAAALARRKDLADLLVGVTGDFVPGREVLAPSFLLRLLGAALGIGGAPAVAGSAPAPAPRGPA